MNRNESIEAAISALKNNRPLRAEEVCRDFLLLNPGSAEHLRLLGQSLMKQGRLNDAETQIREALNLKPDIPQLYEDLGSVLAMQEKYEDAIPQFERAIRIEPRLSLAHKKLGQALVAAGRGKEADKQFEEFLGKDPEAGVIAVGANHLREGRIDEAKKAFQDVLRKNPDNVTAMRHLAILYFREENNPPEAEAWLRRATSLAPDFTAAWMTLGLVLLEMNKNTEAIACYQSALKADPESGAIWAALANAYAQASYPEKSIQTFETAISKGADSAGLQMSYAHVLKTMGNQADALNAYRKAIEMQPELGEAYWSMANLKIFTFEDEEIAAMERQLEKSELSDVGEVHFRFALGKAFEDDNDIERVWHYYDSGNRKQRPLVTHSPLEMEHRHKALRRIFTAEFIARNEGNGHDAPDPILIVGLPRSGSTLVEQILASHSQVEGTSELPILSKLAANVGRYRTDGVTFPGSLENLDPQDWRGYGQEYMEQAKRHRATGKPFFTDKLPNNFPLVGFLHLVLPNAKVINARRFPLDSCLGAYKQLFAKGQNFTYDIEDLAHYYANYHQMMKHWHVVLPGKVLDVHYELTVTDLESQVRRILDHCGLPFEQACVDFHETKRAVKTASSEQVRQPIYTGALGKWKQYEGFLDIWKSDLKEVIEDLPEDVRTAAGHS